jgi:hypothetical protein
MGSSYGKAGLALVVAFLFWSASASSSAFATPDWRVGGVELTGSQAVSEVVSVKSSAVVLTVPAFLRLSCSGEKVKEALITGPKKGSMSAMVLSGCSVLTSTGATTKCTVRNVGGTAGTISSSPLDWELSTQGGQLFDTTVAHLPPIIIRVVIEAMAGSSCALSGTFEVSGSVAFQPASGTNAVELAYEASEAIQKAGGRVLKFGTREAILDTQVTFKLESGKTWGVDP